MNENKINILILGPDRRKAGGIATVIHNFYTGELTRKFRFTYILTQVNQGKVAKFLQLLRALADFLKNIMSREINLIHIHTASRVSFFRKSLFVLIAGLYRKKVILHIHGGAFHNFYTHECNILQKYYVRKITNSAKVVIVLSDQWTQKLSGIIRPELIKVLPNPVRIPDIDTDSLARDEKIINILFMGILARQKGVYDLITAAGRLTREHKNLKFILGGVGETEQIKKCIRQGKLEDFFELPGWIDEKEKYYSHADIFVLPSYVEALPMSLLEAASYGLPIVATNVGAIPEIIKDGESGYLINAGDIDALAGRLDVLLNNKEHRQTLGKAARQAVIRSYSSEKVLSQLESLYLSLCGHN